MGRAQDGSGAWWLVGLLAVAAAALAEPSRLPALPPDPGAAYDDAYPAADLARFFPLERTVGRDEAVRAVLREHLSAIPPEAFDVMRFLNGRDAGSIMARGTKLGLFAGSAAYCASELCGSDSWLIGTTGLAAGFLTAAATDVNWPPTFTVRLGQQTPWNLGLGWLDKPNALPRHRPQMAWRSGRGASTAGIGLSYLPSPRHAVRFDLFLDPFAAPGDTTGGLQMGFGF